MNNKHYEVVHRYDFLTKELLEQEYVINGLTDREIADKYNMPSKVVVWRKRKKFGILNRLPGKSNTNAKKNRKYSISYDDAKQMLDDRKLFSEIAEMMGCSIIVAKRRFKELGLCVEQEQTGHYAYYDTVLSPSQKQLLIGSTLGDGTITVSGAYSCSHSKKQLDYFNNKMAVLSNICSGKKQSNSQFFEKTGTTTHAIHFTTGCNKYCYHLRNIFYPNDIKIVPFDFLMENLEAQGLAYWYMDDGGYGLKSSILSTCSFKYEENKMLQKLFWEKFKIKFNINGNKDGRWILRCPTNSTPAFISLIRPYILPIFRYKLGE